MKIDMTMGLFTVSDPTHCGRAIAQSQVPLLTAGLQDHKRDASVMCGAPVYLTVFASNR